MSKEDLVLYVKPGCPYCHKVEAYMEQHHLELAEKDIVHDPDACDELVRVGGKQQVPCLFIDGKPMYESDDIIEYLAAHEA